MPENHGASLELRARVAMEKHRFRTTRTLGQNFILDDRLIDGLLDAIDLRKDDCVLEIGPGAGVMTRKLAERAGRVLAVEIDRGLAPVLDEVLAGLDNVQVVYQDFMKADLDALIDGAFGRTGYRVVANLPYYITADIMLRLVSARRRPESIAIMVQREAADRMMSAPGEKQWCALAATLSYYGCIQAIADVPPEAFYPMPHVTSTFIRMDLFGDDRPIHPRNEKLFLRLINAAFAMRRKTLANNLKAAFGLDQAGALDALQAAGLDERVRGESLTLEQLAALADVLDKRISQTREIEPGQDGREHDAEQV